jgi:hypothetical protein
VVETPDFDLVAASLRADSSDLATFVEALATKLEASFPGHVRIERKGSRFVPGARPVRRISIPLGESTFELDHEGGRVTCSRRAVVRGIALRTEELPLGDWIDTLSAALVSEAGSSESAREALQKLLQ